MANVALPNKNTDTSPSFVYSESSSGAVVKTPIANIVTPTGTQTLTNKTLTSPTITSPTITTGTANGLTIGDTTDTTKKVTFDASGVTTGTTRTLTVPDASGTIALTSQLPNSAYGLIGSQTVSAGAQIDFTTGFDSTYDEYVFLLIGLFPATAGTNLLMRVSIDSGATFLATNYFGALSGYGNGFTSNGGSGTLDQLGHPLTSSLGPNNAAADALTGKAHLILTATRATMQSQSGWKNNSGTAVNQMAVSCNWSNVATASRVNAVRFLATTGNITGTVRMYGVKNA